LFSLVADQPRRNCEGYSRREFLRVGALGGLSLSHLLALQGTAAAAGGKELVRDKAVVVLWLDGGPPQAETFDPNPEAPSEYRSMYGQIPTTLPGVYFGSQLPRLAAHADKLSIVRSLRHGNHRHGQALRLFGSAGNPTKAHISSVYARCAGLSHPATGMPRNALVTPMPFREDYTNGWLDRFAFSGQLPEVYKAFDPAGSVDLLDDMRLSIPESRLLDRTTLLSRLDGFRRRLESSNMSALNRYQKQALEVISGGISQAFDISREDPRLLERYDTSHIDFPESMAEVRAQFSPASLGKQMVLARRMVEAGCGFVTVRCQGWDMHVRQRDYLPVLMPAVDKVASTFIEDLEERGLTDRVLFIITGEFGRSPRINPDGGRDHWGNLCPIVFHGGGLPTGQVIGRSDRLSAVPATAPIDIGSIAATILFTLMDPAVLSEQELPDELKRWLVGIQPIPELT
jgi:uncharacterized protein (DUF1501 family)